MADPTSAQPVVSSLALALVTSSDAPILLLDGDLNVVAASASFSRAFQLDPAALAGWSLFALGAGEWDVPQLRSLLKATLSGAADIETYEMDLRRPGQEVRRLVVTAHQLVHDEAGTVRLLLSVTDVTNARLADRLKDDLIREKAILFQELQHRVANSLQIIASILLMKARTVQSEETRLQLEDAHQRVLSVAAVQQHLHVEGGGKPIEIGTYLTKLCETLAESMIGDSRPIALKVTADAGTAMSREAVSIGLVVTELVMNALKHAFPALKTDAAILVHYNVAGPDWKLTVSDNGVGKPDVSASATKPGLGTSLIKALTRQLDAILDTATGPRGTAVSLTHATFKTVPAQVQ